jgi:hypothetical protein
LIFISVLIVDYLDIVDHLGIVEHSNIVDHFDIVEHLDIVDQYDIADYLDTVVHFIYSWAVYAIVIYILAERSLAHFLLCINSIFS